MNFTDLKKTYIHQVMASNGNWKLMLVKIILQVCYQKIMNDILPFILFHSFFHNSYNIINIEIWILQTSKSQYIHQVMASNGIWKLMLAKIILQLSYQKIMNDILPILLFDSFLFHNSCLLNHKQWNMNFTELKKTIYSSSYGIKC